MKSDIKDINGVTVQVGDYIQLPYIPPHGETYTEEEDFNKRPELFKVVFEFGAMGIYSKTKFIPLFEIQRCNEGEYIPGIGNKTIYTEEYIFRVVKLDKPI